jgi:16S rRNA (guanine527-N7)-methyltransferase
MGHFIFARGQRVMDVGTGAGFPGLVLKIVRPDLTLTLVDSVGKKTTFLTHVTERLSLDNVQILTARAEDLGQNPQHREGYEVVMARAVAQLPTLAEYLLPLCRVGGVCLAMKGENLPEELAAAQSALKILGGNARPPIPIQLPEGEQRHYLLFIDKQRPTPSAYPRRAGVPRKTPLGPGD